MNIILQYFNIGNLIQKDLPIMYNMNFGHTVPMMIIPYGALAEIDCNNKFSILEPGALLFKKIKRLFF